MFKITEYPELAGHRWTMEPSPWPHTVPPKPKSQPKPYVCPSVPVLPELCQLWAVPIAPIALGSAPCPPPSGAEHFPNVQPDQPLWQMPVKANALQQHIHPYGQTKISL